MQIDGGILHPVQMRKGDRRGCLVGRLPQATARQKRFDLQKLPGMTAKIAEQMVGMTLEDIVELGENALQADFKGVGPSRAKAIYAAALERIGA